MELLYQGIRLLINPFFNILTIFLNFFIHRDKSVILFGGRFGERFAGNSRFLFQFCHKERRKLGFTHVIWVTRSRKIYDEISSMGYECFMMHSFESMFYHLKAGRHIIDGSYIIWRYSDRMRYPDILTLFSNGAECYQLTHVAKQLKDVESAREGISKYIWGLYKIINTNDFVREFIINPGGWANVIYLSNHEVENGGAYNVKVTGMPELCPCIEYTPSEKMIIDSIPRNRRLLLYTPTVHMKEAKQYAPPLNDADFCEYLLENNYYWIEKLHPAASEDMKASDYDSRYALLLDAAFDVNIIIPKIDLMITDYSSIYQKAVWYNIPYAFYTSDLDYFISHDTGIAKWFMEFASAEFCYDTKMLEKDIEKKIKTGWIESKKDDYEKLREELYNVDGTNYEKICEMLFCPQV